MGKISPVSGKYIIHATLFIDGVVDRPDVIGAIFGQTEGLLGSDLELRELQRSGRIGRIEVISDHKGGKTQGTITIPSSMDKSETAIIGAAMEVIERIGPCNADIKVKSIEDIRISKRAQVISRAKDLLRRMMDSELPDSTEIAEEVAESVRVMEITTYGKDKLPAGPGINESDDLIVVEGRADVLALLKHGFKNVIAMNGANAPQTIIDLCREKNVNVFVDGDRGGDLNVKELAQRTEIDFVSRAPDGKEVEELAKKEIHKALRSKVTLEQAMADIAVREKSGNTRPARKTAAKSDDRRGKKTREPRESSAAPSQSRSAPKLSDGDKKTLHEHLDSLVGTHGALVLDNNMAVLGKVPRTELQSVLSSLDKGSVRAVVLDGKVDQKVVDAAKKASVTCVVGTEADTKLRSNIDVLTAEQLA